MAFTLKDLAELSALPFDTIIDARSPSEFAEDHIPGAINLPSLTDAERAEVGTIYVQEEPFKARKIGAAYVARNVANYLQGPLAHHEGGWQPLVYCWRGGQRSNAFASILSQIGWRAEVVAGGYKSYRSLVVSLLHDTAIPNEVILIEGGTGSAKTQLLHHIADQGGQVIDLEGAAEHRGSLFGQVGARQPSQKMFESRIAETVVGLSPDRPVFVEAESSKVGDCLVPPSLWKAMLRARYVEIAAPPQARARHVVDTYPDIIADPDRLSGILGKLAKFRGHAQVEAWQEMADAQNWTGLAQDLIERHYDPAYKRIRAGEDPLHTFELADLSETTLSQTATEILSRFG